MHGFAGYKSQRPFISQSSDFSARRDAKRNSVMLQFCAIHFSMKIAACHVHAVINCHINLST